MNRNGKRVAASGRPPAGHDVEQVRVQVDRLCWTGITLGLAFTMTNVQHFAAAGSSTWSPQWLAAWLLDPTVSLVLIAILRAEQVTARRGVRMGPWVRRAKWFTLAATYVMNTWSSFEAGSWSGIVLHSVPPLLVFTAAEAVTDLRETLVAMSKDDGPQVVNEKRPVPRRTGRKLFADYLAEARDAWSPQVEVTPAWVRQVTACSRGLSPRVAAALRAEVDGREVQP